MRTPKEVERKRRDNGGSGTDGPKGICSSAPCGFARLYETERTRAHLEDLTAGLTRRQAEIASHRKESELLAFVFHAIPLDS
jgi:hypothetical protein